MSHFLLQTSFSAGVNQLLVAVVAILAAVVVCLGIILCFIHTAQKKVNDLHAAEIKAGDAKAAAATQKLADALNEVDKVASAAKALADRLDAQVTASIPSITAGAQQIATSAQQITSAVQAVTALKPIPRPSEVSSATLGDKQ